MSKLIKCPTCKKRIAVDAPACPKCGHALTDEERDNGVREERKSCLGCLVFFLVVCAVGFVMEMFDKDKKNSAPVVQTESQALAPQQKAPPAPVVAQTEQSIPLDLSRAPTPEEEKESAAARERMAKKSPPVQAELNKFYKELLAMRGTKDFVELGFSGNNKKAADWKKRVEAFRVSIEKDNDLPVQVRAAPAYMLTIGFAKEWRAGKDTADSKWDTQMILDGINWKLEE